MKKTVLSFCVLLLMACTTEKFDPTEIWDNIHSLDERVTSLEQLCREMNTNIGSLQTIVSVLENQDYIKNVSPVSEDGAVIGYTITFAQSGTVTIYHGKDGAKGEQGDKGETGDKGDTGAVGPQGPQGEQGEKGEAGETPVIGVAKDTDGVYYWTLNGRWLVDESGNKIPTTGKDGAQGETGATGPQGSQGEQGPQGETGAAGPQGPQGEAGKDGVTPQLKIEDGRWLVSYDSGQSWMDVGQATGDQGPQGATGATGPQGPQGEQGDQGIQGPQGNPGVSGDSMFTDVNYSNSDYVLFVLSNGQQFKIPTWSAFESLKEQCDQMNSNIDALQTVVSALQNNDYVTSVTPIYEGVKEIGYIINFSKGGKATIYHGKDGARGEQGDKGETGDKGDKGDQGEAGVDGQTPVIGIKQDTDGIYYWTLNGSWLLSDGQKVKAVGTDGAKGETGAQGPQGDQGIQGETGATGPQGPQGEQGVQGEAGKDGVTPQLKIEDGKWLISYDKGATWEEVGQATGDQGPQGETGATGPQGPQGEQGIQGEPGKDGDSFFQSVATDNPDYVVITLIDGQQFKIPTWSAFESMKEQCAQMNTNIQALQTVVAALQNNDYVTSVTPIYEGAAEIGYIINFSKGGKTTIYHGRDGDKGDTGATGPQGEQGEKGEAGETPVIGVAKDTDGVYYWTLNGRWLVDESGNKVPTTGKDGADGSQGATGSTGPQGATGATGPQGPQGVQGEAGKDGVTPQLKIEDGRWLVSYDSGQSWADVGQATGDQGPQGATGATGSQGPQGDQGIQGEAGKDGDSFFQSVATDNPDYVVITLIDGQQFKIPTWSAFESLKEQCEQMNTNIQALQTVVAALQNNGYVTSVTPIYDGAAEIGYIINFSKGGKATIYHGKDGEKGDTGAVGPQGPQGEQGEKGEAGETPVIGVAKDTDGVYYWTLNGRWLVDESDNKIPTTGKDGAQGETGATGPQGATGATGPQGPQGVQGEAGKDGVTPQLKIEDGRWLVSYDSGQSWADVGQATGDQGSQGATGATGPQGPQGDQGIQGEPGKDGDSFFQSVAIDNPDYVVITLIDGQQFKIPTWSAFESLKEQCAQMNTNIQALQTVVAALQNNDYVTSVTPIYDGAAEIGYIINFSKGGKATIYHGKDGEKGEQGDKGDTGAVGPQGPQGEQGEKGEAGDTPVIGVAKDADGVYYWTLNGSWLVDESGNKILTTGKDGVQGATGATGPQGATGATGPQGPQGEQGETGATGPQGPQGVQGEAGKDGVAPQLKIEDGRWLVSYDSGQSWVDVGQATGDQGPQGATGATGPQGPQGEQGIQGEPGKDGDSFFQSVTQDEDNVYMILADGTTLTVSKTPPPAATLVLTKTTGFTATFGGTIMKKSLDLKVTIYYSTVSNLTIYKNKGKVSVTEFDGNSFTLKLTGLGAETTYYYFTEIISDGIVRYSGISSFRTGKADSYVDWEEGENVGGEI